jgi:hypothetical protein
MSRPGALLVVAVTVIVASCDYFTPPCTKVARAICDIGREGDSCAFVLGRGRDDAHAQLVCSDILPAAQALGADPKSESAWNDWMEARQKLQNLGMQVDPAKGNIANKLIQAGGLAGKVVKDLQDNSKAAEQNTMQAAQHALDEANR